MRTKIRNTFLGLAAIITLLLLCFIAFYTITLRKANHVPIPNNAVWMMKINGVNAIKNLWENALEWNAPSDSAKHTTHGMSMPLHFYIYNTKNCPNTFFTSVILNDEHLVHTNLTRKSAWKLVDSLNHLYVNESQNIALTFNRSYATVAWNFKQQGALDELIAISKQTNTTKYSDTKFSDVLTEDHLIIITNLKSNFYLNFEKGFIDIGGEWYGQNIANFSPKIETNEQVIVQLFNAVAIKDDKILQSIFGTEAFSTIKTQIISANYCLDINICEPNIMFEKEVRTYEFDENFEKKEVIVNETVQMPKVSILWKTAQNDTLSITSTKPELLNDSIFPLFPMYAYPVQGSYILWSNSTTETNHTQVKADYCLKVKVNIAKAKQNEYFSAVQQYLTPFESFELTGTKTDNFITLKGKMLLVDKETNSLQAIRNWWNAL